MKRTTRKVRRRRPLAKFQLPSETKIDYKNIAVLQRFVNDRGKIASRRITGTTAKQQRLISQAVKQAKFLALLPTGSVRKT